MLAQKAGAPEFRSPYRKQFSIDIKLKKAFYTTRWKN
jgi:hypothetical protein